MDESLRTEVRVKHFVYILMDSCIEETTEEQSKCFFINYGNYKTHQN